MKVGDHQRQLCFPRGGTVHSNIRLSSVDGQPLEGFYLREFLHHEVHASQADSLVVYEFGERRFRVVPRKVQELLLGYLQKPFPGQAFDCVSFVQRVLRPNRLPAKDLCARGGWSEVQYTKEKRVLPGDIVCLYSVSDPKKVAHAAIKLCDGYYLSKAGLEADFLLLSTISNMQLLWRAPMVRVLRAA